MAALEDAGYIRRIRRIRRGLGGRPEYTSTLYILPAKARQLIRRLARSTAALSQWARETWAKAKQVVHRAVEITRGSINPAVEALVEQVYQQQRENEARLRARSAERLKGLDLSDPIKAMMQILDR